MNAYVARSLVRSVLAGLWLAAAGCSAGGHYVWVHERPPDPVKPQSRIVIGPGDLIEIQMIGDESTPTTARVLRDGTLTVPLLGPVPVAGKTSDELAASLEQQLKRYVTVPKVVVFIRESVTSVAVIGEVRQAGVMEMPAPASVLETLAKAGGLTEYADPSAIFVLRTQGGKTERIRFSYAALIEAEPAATRFQLKTGDVVVVQ
jgi:polysaccharide export outer membrane protein